MARLSSYTKDASITEKDKLAGSSYVGLVNGIPKYQTASYTIEDLAEYFSQHITIGGQEYDITAMYSDIQNNKTSIASINTSLTVLANEDLALAQSITNLDTQFTTDLSDAVSSINITLTSLSTADLALAESITTLETSFTTDLSDAVATINTSLTALSTADAALATSITELETSFTTDLSEAVATINTELTTLSTADQALATSITELETSFATDLSDAVATINTELTTLSTADQALATSITELETTFTTDLSEAVATINTELTTLSTADEALATSITTLETNFTTDLATTNAAITAETLARSTEDEALALSITTLETDLTTDIATVSAAVTAETLARSTEDEALALSITTLEANITTDIADVSAAITAEQLARTTEDEALALSITTLETNLTTDLADVNAAITAEQLARSTEDEALALSITTLEADIATDIADVNSAITAEQLARATEDEALATSITTLETNLTTDISDVSAAVTAETLARTTEDEALALAITTLESDLTTDISDVSAAVTAESLARTTADSALATDITAVEAAVEIKPNVYRQDEEPATTVPVSSIWYDTNDGNKQYVLVAGDPNVWTEVTDQRLPNTVSGLATANENITANTSAIQAEASKVTELQSQFTFSGENITGTSDALNTSIQTAASNAAGAVATDLDKLETLFTFDGNGDVSGLAPATTISSAVASAETNAISAADLAAASRDTNLRVLIQTDDVAPVQAALDIAESSIARLDGYAESKYTLTATAGNVITGMSILASSGGGAQDISEVKFQADRFIIQSSSYDATPFVLDNNELKLNVPLNGVSGTFSGNLFAALGTNSVVNPDAYIAFGNVEVSNEDYTITKNFPVLELADDFRAIQARRAIYINTVVNDTQEFTGIRFFGTRLDENGDEDLANKGLSIKADEIELRYFNHPDDYVPTKMKWADKSIIDGPTYKTEIYAEWNDTDKPYIVIDADVRFAADVDLGSGQIVGHPDINAGTSTSNASGTSTVIKNIDLDGNGHVLDIESISLTLDNITNAGNTTNNNIFVNNVIGDAFIFDTANPETALSVGGTTWNNQKGTLNLHVKEGVYYRVNQQTFFYGKATEAISKGQVVMFAGVQGSHVLIAKADMNAPGFIPEYVIGVAAEDFSKNEFGHVIEFGELIGFNTTMYEDGDLLYLDPDTPGGYVTSEPDSADGHSILIAAVINTQNSTNGGIIVRPSHKVGIDELHDVDVTGKVAGDMLVYDDTTEKWVAKNELTDLKLYGQLTGPSTFVIDPAIVGDDTGTVEIRGDIDVNGNGNFDGNVVIDGDLTVSGTTVTINATNLAVQDNMIYLNEGSSVSNPDLGFSGNYNDGTYRHAGLFRDATDGIWKFFKNYEPEPDASAYIDTSHATFAFADVQAASFTGNLTGNVTGNVTGNLTGTASSATNADTVDSKHATDFTLDYVISNNHVTTRDVTMADISADNIDLGGSLVVDGTINGKTTIKGDFNSLNTTGFVIAKLGVSGAINNELFTITVFGTGYYQRTVFSCTHPGTPTTDWSTWISINEGDDIFLISPSNVNNELVLTLKASQVISDLGGSYFIEHIGDELIKV
jgi:hypothetical protein